MIQYQVCPKVSPGDTLYPLTIYGEKIVTLEGTLSIYDDKGKLVLRMPAGEWLYVKAVQNV